MKNEDVSIGMKVVPTQKTGNWPGIAHSIEWKKCREKNQPFMYVTGFDKEDGWILSHEEILDRGDYFLAEDFYPYVSPSTFDLASKLNELANVGFCPALIFDDNGHWALAFDGTQSVASLSGPVTTYSTFFVEADMWKDTIEEAVEYSLSKLF